VTFSYDPNVSTNRDKVRVLLGDTVATNAMFSDEELCFFETEFGPSIYGTTLAAIEAGIAKYSRAATSKSVGPLSISYADRVRNLERARDSIKVLAMKGASPIPYVGGIRKSDKETDENDEDMVGGWARKGGFDNPGAADQDDMTQLVDRDGLGS
jgi:hypothetical protein